MAAALRPRQSEEAAQEVAVEEGHDAPGGRRSRSRSPSSETVEEVGAHQQQAQEAEEQVRRPHGRPGRHEAAVGEALAADQEDPVGEEEQQAQGYGDGGPPRPDQGSQGSAHEDEDDAGEGDGELLVDLHEIGVGPPLAAGVLPPVLADRGSRTPRLFPQSGGVRGILLDPGQEGLRRGVDGGAGAGVLAAGLVHGVEHGRHTHLAIRAVGRAEGGQLRVPVADVDHLAPEAAPAQTGGIVGVGAVDLSVLEGEAHVPPVGEDLQASRVGTQGRRRTAPAGVVEGDVVEAVGTLVDAADQEAVGAEIADEDALLLLEDEGRLAALQAGGQLPGAVVRVGQHPVVEPDHGQGQQYPGHQDRGEQVSEADPRRLPGQDLVVGGQAAEDHEHGNQHRHGHRQGRDPGQVAEEELEGDADADALAEQLVQKLQHDIDLEDEHDQAEAEGEGVQVRAQQIAGEGNQEARDGSV